MLPILVISHLFYYLFVTIFSVCALSDDICYNNVEIYHNSSLPFYDILNSSASCVQQYNTLTGGSIDFEQEPPFCPPGLLSIQLSPQAEFGTGNILPHVQLNISVLVFSMVTSLFLRLHCLNAPNGEDVYCHDATRMIVNGVWQWPCRALLLRDDSTVQFPFQFGYSCFRMYGLSQYMVNVTVFPQNCRASLLVSSPQDSQLFPEIAEFYAHKPLVDAPWSPTLVVDLADSDGIWLRAAYPHNYTVRIIVLSLFEETDENVRLLETVELNYPNTGYKWHNAPVGKYILYGHVPRHDCLLLCDSSVDSNCRVCPHTYMKFNLEVDRTSFAWKGLRTIKSSGAQILIFMICIFFLLTLVGFVVIFAMRRARRAAQHDIPLVERPTVLLVYSHDCPEHFDVVQQFSTLIARCANATVLVDHQELNMTGVRPSVWLVNSLRRADRVLVITSSATQSILDGKQLVQTKPYPDLFMPAVQMIIKDCVAGNSSRFAIVRLPYTPEDIPYQLKILSLKTFSVPSQLANLTAFLHGFESSGGRVQQSIDLSILAPFQEAIDKMKRMTEASPSWMQNVWEEEVSPRSITVDQSVHENLCEPVIRGTTEGERKELAKEYGILPPDEGQDNDSIEEEADSKFQLLPPDSSDSD